MDVKYDEELVKDIQEIFIKKIVFDNFILVIHKYNRLVLTVDDIERLRKSINFRASKDVNYDLLLTMSKYNGWFEVILQVCNDPDVKQHDVAVAFKTIKKELDERWTRDHTKKKEIAMELSNVSLTSESNQRTANEVFETDQGAVCMSSENRWQEDTNSNHFSKDNDSVPTHLSSWIGVIRKNDKPYCTVCLTALTSDKAAEDHCKGKQHRKKLKEAGLVSHDGPGTRMTMAAISQVTYDGAKSEPNSGSNEPSVSSGSMSDYKVAPASWTPLSCRDEGNKKELLTESQSVTASHPCWGGLEMKNGNLYCRICDVSLTSQTMADAHCKGKPHEKKLNRAFPMNQGMSESGITTVRDFPASSASISAVPTSFELSGSCETAVNSGQISDSNMTTASFKLTFSIDKTPTTSSAIKATLTNCGATKTISSGTGVFEATPVSSSVTKTMSSSSDPTKATRTCSGATEATLVSPDSSHAIDEVTTQASGIYKEYIIDDGNGKLKCRLCDVPVTSGDNASQHLQGSKHKKKLEALKDRDDTPSSSVVTKATPTCSGATEATLASPDSSHVIDAGCKQASGSDKEYIVDDGNGKLKCRLCDLPVTLGVNAAQHLQDSKHKKKFEALKRQDDSNETPPELGPKGEIITCGEPTGKCYVCNIPINSRESAKQHREGRKHINRCKQFKLPVM